MLIILITHFKERKKRGGKPYKQNVTFFLCSLLDLIPGFFFSLQEHQDFPLPPAFVISPSSKAAEFSCLWIKHGDEKNFLLVVFFQLERKYCPLHMPSNACPC